MGDRHALAGAFEGAETVFVLRPSNFDPAPDSSENRVFTEALAAALQEAAPARVVGLSTIGAQATQENLLTRLQVLERALSRLPMPVAFLRAAWFMENARWDIEGARQHGVCRPSCSRPTSRCRWSPPPTSPAWPRSCCASAGKACEPWSWRARHG